MRILVVYGQGYLDSDAPLMEPKDALRLLGLHRPCNRAFADKINNCITDAIEDARSDRKDVYLGPMAGDAWPELADRGKWSLDPPDGVLADRAYRMVCIQALRVLIKYVIFGGSFASLYMQDERGVVGDNLVQSLSSLHVTDGATDGAPVGDDTVQADNGIPSSERTTQSRRGDSSTGNLNIQPGPNSLEDGLAEQFEGALHITAALDQLVPSHVCLHGRRNAISAHGGTIYPSPPLCLRCDSYSCCCCCCVSSST